MILLELFTDKYQYHPIEKNGRVILSYFEDVTGEEVVVRMSCITRAEKSHAYAVGFKRKNEGTFLTNDGKEVSKLLATVIAITDDMIKYIDKIDKELNEFIDAHFPKIEVLVFTAETQSNRARLYERMVDRMATKYGFTRNVKPEIVAEIDALPRGDSDTKLICLARKGSNAAA